MATIQVVRPSCRQALKVAAVQRTTLRRVDLLVVCVASFTFFAGCGKDVPPRQSPGALASTSNNQVAAMPRDTPRFRQVAETTKKEEGKGGSQKKGYFDDLYTISTPNNSYEECSYELRKWVEAKVRNEPADSKQKEASVPADNVKVLETLKQIRADASALDNADAVSSLKTAGFENEVKLYRIRMCLADPDTMLMFKNAWTKEVAGVGLLRISMSYYAECTPADREKIRSCVIKKERPADFRIKSHIDTIFGEEYLLTR